MFGIGNRIGPAIYPRGVHEIAYILAYEGRFHEKPRVDLDTWMYRRPYYYGFPRRLKSQQERDDYIARLEKNNPGSRFTARAKEMNQEANQPK